jgi:hypothetical protein
MHFPRYCCRSPNIVVDATNDEKPGWHFRHPQDVDHWLASPKREEVFGPMGITIRTFVDPENTNRVGLIAEIPDLDAYREVTASQAAADARNMTASALRPWSCW